MMRRNQKWKNTLKHSETNETIIKESEFNCLFCDFQGTELLQLNRHINLKHTAFCKMCDFQASVASDSVNLLRR